MCARTTALARSGRGCTPRAAWGAACIGSLRRACYITRCAGAASQTAPRPGLQVAGHVEVLDDCTFSVTGFYYDGCAPCWSFHFIT